MTQEVKDKLFRSKDYRRIMQLRAVEQTLSDESDYYVLEGKAVVFEEPTVLFKYYGIEYKEVIRRGAFIGADISDVFLKYNHESSVMATARTKNGTLDIDIREDGVYVVARLLKTLRASQELYEGVKSGLIDKMSFAFTIKEEIFEEDTNTYHVISIDKVYDVAAVEIPAYSGTELHARRSNDVEARLREVEASSLEQTRKILLSRLKNN